MAKAQKNAWKQKEVLVSLLAGLAVGALLAWYLSAAYQVNLFNFNRGFEAPSAPGIMDTTGGL